MKQKFRKAGMGTLLALMLSSCNFSWQQDGSGSREYKTLTVTTGERTLFREYAAAVQGRQSVEIRPQVSGTITEVCIDEGAKVRKGQTLFVIDQVPYRAALETAEANVRSAGASVATARLTAGSKRELHREQIVSDFDLQTAENSLAQAEAALAQAEAQRTSARNDLSYTTVKSPVDGVAGMLPYRVGALVGSSISDPLCVVSDDREMYAYFSVSEKELLSLVRENGSSEEYLNRLPAVSLRLADGSPYEHAGRIDAVSGTIERTTGSVTLRATFPNPSHLLRNGGSGTVVIPYVRSGAVVIPQEATFEIQDRIFVYRVVDGKAVSAEIKVFPLNDGREYIVESGIKEGDVIIAEGAGLVREGASVDGTSGATNGKEE